MTKIIERQTTEADGTVTSQFYVRRPTPKKKYYKMYAYPDAEVPLYFLSACIDVSYLSPEHLGLCFDTFRVVERLENVSRASIQRYIKELVDAEFLLKLKKGTYLINPSYIHTGSQYATEDAIKRFDACMRKRYEEDGRDPTSYIPFWSVKRSPEIPSRYVETTH